MPRTNLATILSLLLGATALAACSGGKNESESASTTNASNASNASNGTGETSSSSSGGMATTTSASGSATDSATGTTAATATSGTTGCNIFDCTDMGTVGMCDIWAQDCPDGEKCMPYADDGGNAWNATKCSPVDRNAAGIGEECMGGGVSGVDNCVKGSMCYYVDGETGLGVCVAFCTGSADAPMCQTLEEVCSISNDGVLILCRKNCNPLLQDCEGSAACLPASGTDKFVCIVDASGDTGAPGDPCEYLNSCDPGLLCADAQFVPGCQASGCCTEFCDLNDPNKDDACSKKGEGVTCEAYYEMDPPPGLENIGVCILPP
ncbi:MAG: ribulose phosphate epimerase [Myxococcales bacterium]|nr:ribulose phosphate epimerase [Myxococcales bacterium]